MTMHEHDEIRNRLTLAAAGALSATEQKQLEEHISRCAECRAEFAGWSRLLGALEKIPTPQAPPGLVERTRRTLEKQAAMNAERRRQRWLFFWLTAFAWASTLLTWPLFHLFAGRVSEIFDLSWTHLSVNEVWVGYMFLVGTIGALVAGLLGKRGMQEARTI